MQILHRKQSRRAVDRRGAAPVASPPWDRPSASSARECRAFTSACSCAAHDVPVTIYGDKEPDEIRAGRLLNTVAHHHHTLERERALGCRTTGTSAEYGYGCHHHCVGGELRFRGDFEHPSSSIDYRVYLPRLMEDFQERGGELVIMPSVGVAEVERLSERHELMVIAVGRRSMEELFGRRDDKSPYDRPQRRLSAGIYHGIEYSDPKGVGVALLAGPRRAARAADLLPRRLRHRAAVREHPRRRARAARPCALRRRSRRLRPPRARRPADPLPDGRRARRPRCVRPVVGPRSPAGRADADRARGLRAPEQRALRAGHGRRAHRRGSDDGAGRRTRPPTRRGRSARRSSPTTSTTSASARASRAGARASCTASRTGPT